MRCLLTIVILLMAIPCLGQDLATYTVCESGGGCDYTTVQAAETAHEQDLAANDSALTFEIQNTWASTDGFWTIDGSITDATRFITVTAVGAARASATWSTTAYRVDVVANAISLRDPFAVLDGVQAKTSQTNGTAVTLSSGAVSVTIKNCFLSGAEVSGTRCIISINGANTAAIRNNVIIDGSDRGIYILSGASGGIIADNNTIENCGTGIETSTGDTQIRNNIIWNTTTPLIGNFVELSQENYTDAVSVSYGSCSDCGTGDQLSQSDPFENLGGENYLLASGATAIDAGQDLSGDFTDAIGGKTRDANFDKGADEFIAAAGGTTLEGVTLEGVTIE